MEIPQPLLDDIVAEKCLPFIGAGFSLNANLPKGLQMPTWPKLTDFLANIVQVSSKLGGPKVASEFEKKYGRVQLIEAIRKALHSDHAKPGEAHKAFVKLPFDTVYTTNFDLLLEDSYRQLCRPYRSLVGELQMPFHGGRLTTNIVKMHGDLRHEEHIIITTEDYANYLKKYPVIATHLSAMLITRTPLFIGYSLSDPDFQNIREVVQSRLGKFERMSYIITFDVSPEDVKSLLKSNLYVISIPTESKNLKDSILAEFFQYIQTHLDIQEGERFRASKPDIFEEVTKETFVATSQAFDSSSLLTSSSNLCFVMMPIGLEYESTYRSLIKPVAEQFGLAVLRADEINAPGSIMEQIRTAIQQSRLCIVDITDQNPNVMYELAISQTLGKPTVIISNKSTKIPFDISSIRIIFYEIDSLERARSALEEAIKNVLGSDRLDEAQRLIENGLYRAAVAMLGVLLEHSLRQLIIKYINSALGKGIPLGMRQSLGMLVEAGIIKSDDESRLIECIMIRNKAVHELEEPTAQNTQLMFLVVKEFIDKYINPE